MEAPQQLFAMCEVKGAIQRDLVLFVDLVARMSENEREIAVVGQDEQALALAVEPADMKNAGPFGRKALVDRFSAVFIAGRDDVATRLVQEHVERLLGVHHLLAHFHHVRR